MSKKKKILLYTLLFLVLYVGQVVQVRLYDRYLKNKVAAFDLNGDGVFSREEQTPEQQKYFNSLIGDGGRNLFTPIIALFTSFAVVTLVFIGSKAYSYIANRKKVKQ